MNLYLCEVNVPKVLVGSRPVGWRFAFDSGIEHEVVSQTESGTTIRKTAKVVSRTRCGSKSTMITEYAKSQVISSGSEVTPLGEPVLPAA